MFMFTKFYILMKKPIFKYLFANYFARIKVSNLRKVRHAGYEK